jgi:glyoxylase I family protein
MRGGVNHIDLTLKDRGGATTVDAPADDPQYGRDYYAVFCADSDGLKLEYVFSKPA